MWPVLEGTNHIVESEISISPSNTIAPSSFHPLSQSLNVVPSPPANMQYSGMREIDIRMQNRKDPQSNPEESMHIHGTNLAYSISAARFHMLYPGMAEFEAKAQFQEIVFVQGFTSEGGPIPQESIHLGCNINTECNIPTTKIDTLNPNVAEYIPNTNRANMMDAKLNAELKDNQENHGKRNY